MEAHEQWETALDLWLDRDFNSLPVSKIEIDNLHILDWRRTYGADPKCSRILH